MLYLGQLLQNNVRKHPDRMAVVSYTRILTYAQLNEESNRVANALASHGLRKGDSVAMVLRNSVEWSVAFWACQKIGLVCVPLHVRLRPEDLAANMKRMNCKTVIFGESLLEQTRAACDLYPEISLKVCVGGQDSSYTTSQDFSIPWDRFLEQSKPDEAQVPIENDAPALVLFTSGTTGLPKGVVRTQEENMLHALTLAMQNNHANEHETMMSTAPLFHIGGLQGMLKMFALGGTHITLEGINPFVIFSLIESRGVTQLQMLPPATYERLYKTAGWQNFDRSSVWEVCISAGKCTPDYIDHVFEMFPNCHLRPSWGSTEAGSITCMQLSREEYYANPSLLSAVGGIIPLNEVRIVDENDEDVAPGELGEALVRSPMVFKGYVGMPEENNKIFADGVWYRTGDIVRCDPETGLVFFVDRKNDEIKTGGENVFAIEVERVIQDYPGISECAVVGVPDERFGEAIGAAVVLDDGVQLDPEDLVSFCKTHLPSYKKPRYLAVLDALPVNDIGKVAKKELQEKHEELFFPIV